MSAGKTVAAELDPQKVMGIARRILAHSIYDALLVLTPSRGLRAGLYLDVQNAVTKLVYSHFWAQYLHDGRGVVKRRYKQWLVYWPDDRGMDPRIAPIPHGYPTRRSEQKRLTKAQFYDALAQFEDALNRGVPSPVIITRGPTGKADGDPWLTSTGMRMAEDAASLRASTRVATMFDLHLRRGEKSSAGGR